MQLLWSFLAIVSVVVASHAFASTSSGTGSTSWGSDGSTTTSTYTYTTSTTAHTTTEPARAPVITEVRVDNITSTEARFKWKTDTPADSRVLLGGSSLINLSVNVRCDNGGYVTDHCVYASGLLPLTKYYFKVESTSQAGVYAYQYNTIGFTTLALSNSGPDSQPAPTSTTTTPSDTTPPSVTHFEFGVYSDGKITAKASFSEAIDSTSVSLNSVYIVNANTGQKISGTAVAYTSGVSYMTSGPVESGVLYRLIVQNVRDRAGNSMMDEYKSPTFARDNSGSGSTSSGSTGGGSNSGEGSLTTTITSGSTVTQEHETTTTNTSTILPATTNVAPNLSAERILLEPISQTTDISNEPVPTLEPTTALRTSNEGPGSVTTQELKAVSEVTRRLTGTQQEKIESLEQKRQENFVPPPVDVQTPLTALRMAASPEEQPTIDTIVERRDHPTDVLAVYRDSDEDGISDFDETRIYQTDPNNAYTAGGDLSDGERILRGLDVKSTELRPIAVESPLSAGEVVEDLFEVTEIALTTNVTAPEASDARTVQATESKRENIIFSGRALPNGFVTLYIFSTPIVVTVKADSEGRWSYVLDKEIEDGSHELHVAMVNNEGRIIAKSNPVPFVKTAEAIDYSPLILPAAAGADVGEVLRENFVAVGLLIFFIIALFGIFVVGMWRFHSSTPEM